jgi:ACT domain-containing protein
LSSAVVIGDKRKYLTVLLCLRLKDKENLMDEVVDYLKEKGAEVKTIQQAMTCKKVKAIIEHGINQAN